MVIKIPDYKLVYNNELYHYGVKGMKWGKRKARYDDSYSSQLRSAKAAYKSQKRKIDSEYIKAGERYDIDTKGGRIQSKRADDAFDRATDKWLADRKSAKADYKQSKQLIKDTNIKNYRNKIDEAEKASNIADMKWNEVNEQYKSLGKTRVTRMINAMRNKTDAAKAYNKNYDEASSLDDIASDKWYEANRAYIKTGRNRIEAIINNVSYDMRKRKR